MKFSLASACVVGLAAQGAVASTWFGNAVYNKWHQTELERWLADHNVPYPQASDRKELENLVKTHWDDKVVRPYNSWDANTLQHYLTSKGYQAKEGVQYGAQQGKEGAQDAAQQVKESAQDAAQQVKESAQDNSNYLIQKAKEYWTETEESANQAYANVRDWIFDTWTDSQLKAFADKHGIPVPQPRKRDSLLKAVRENYQSAANKISETAAYPGDWLYETWSDSELKAWLDERGYPAPQPSSRDKLVASVRRNARAGSLNLQNAYASASKSAANAQQSLSDALLDSWSDSQIKEWADKNGIKVPQGSKRNELIALARKHRARLYGDNVSATATSAYGAATSNVGSQYAEATNGFAGYTNWFKHQLGLATASASASASSFSASVSPVISASASSASSAASKSSASAKSAASKSASSAKSAASKSGSKTVQKAYDAATESAIKASDYAKEEL